MTARDPNRSPVLWDLLAAKWTFQIIDVLATEPLHFNALKRRLGIPSSTLSARLDQLQDLAIVSRSVEASHPPTVQYELTEKGREIAAVIAQLADIDRHWTE